MRRRPTPNDDDAPLYSISKSDSSRAIDPPSTAPSRAPEKVTKEHGSLQARNEEQRLEYMIEHLAGQSPPWLANALRSLAPVMAVLYKTLNIVGPPIIEFARYSYKTWQLLPKNVLGMIYGLVMCFFGGFFHVTIAAIEAFNMTGGQKIFLCIENLKIDMENVAKANAEDDKKDLDGDGKADVHQVPGDKLVTRKIALALRVVDPERVTNALTGLWQGYMGILVVLKFEFAKVITLAVSIGNQLRPVMAKFVGPSMALVIPKEYHKWIAPIINFSCKFIAMTLAWYIQRLISTIQSAVKGGLLFARSFLYAMTEWTSVELDPNDTFVDEILGWTVAFFGAYFQISSGWDLPWFVDLLLWPIYLLEIFLKWSVTWMDVPPDLE